MDNNTIKNKIQQAIKNFAENDLTTSAIRLFQTLGYNTDRQAPLAQKNFNEFKEDYIDPEKNFNEEKALCGEWTYVDLLFQLSKEEILKQSSLFDTKQVDNTIIETYLFFAIELNNKSYTRTALSNMTREVNKLFPMPVMILFKHGKTLTLSVINRRLHKRDASKDVLEKVTQIKDINIEKPHRAHIDILFDLSFDELQRKHAFTNFVELHRAWQKTLDIKELNKRFFNELANWYFWATTQVVLPDDEIKDKDTRNATGVIRLITRLMFVWFLKEKNLVPEELFDERKLKSILKFSDKKKSTYYKAILQNLFFATLNTKMGKRKFRSKQEKNRDGHYFIHNVFRYEDEFIEPIKTLETYFAPVPFLNGGLFECLDKQIEEKGKLKPVRIDGFSDRDDNVLKVDDDLFFGEEKTVDLTAFYDPKSKRKKHYKVRGLIHILHSYKFTITENTPIDEEIALDPELLGKVFENLLANYNPETKTTARKQTGSFYTPREIVNYMVDESLIAYLKQQLDEKNETEEKIRILLSYSEKDAGFTQEQRDKLIKAIDDIKILDPACGSGAFPMGMLHKLVHILHKIDPKNQKWEQRQLNKVDKLIAEAEEITDTKTRNSVIADLQKNREGIVEAFKNNELDYGRKLFLIENCIYGVDIQAVAAQISKLRFFISLIVDQRTDIKKENLGLRPLPNLETKFVAANTLIELEKPKLTTGDIFNINYEEIQKTKLELKKVRHSYFAARTPKRKEKCRNQDKELRTHLVKLLSTENMPKTTVEKMAKWDPYDQNVSAPFFDPEWMFDIKDGFDVVIGNPPYVLLQERIKDEVDLAKIRKDFKVASYKVDLYHLFYEQGISLLNEAGVLSYISPTNFLLNNYASQLRKIILNSNLERVLLLKNNVFDASVDTGVFIINKYPLNNSLNIVFVEGVLLNEKLNLRIKSIVRRDTYNTKDYIINPEYDSTTIELIKTIETSTNLGDIATVNFGMQLRNRKIFPYDVLQNPNEQELTSYHKQCYTGRDIKEYRVIYANRYCYFNREAQSGGCWDEGVQFAKNKILVPQVGKYPVGGIDKYGYPVLNTAFLIVPFNKSLSFIIQSIINSNVVRYYWSKKYYDQRQTFPKIKGTYLKLLPIPTGYDCSEILQLAELLSIQYEKELVSSSLRKVIEGVILELYFGVHMKERGIDVLKFVKRDIHKVMQGREFEKLSDSEKEEVIEQLHQKWTDPNNEVVKRMAQFKEKSPDILKIILES